MYFVDGPLSYKPNYSGDTLTAEDIFSSPSGIPSVNSGPHSVVAKDVMKSLKSLHKQFSEMHARIANMDLGALGFNEGTSEEPVVKSASEAIKLRNAGNEEFKKNDLDEALKLYTQSIAKASEGSEEQMLAFGNRSAVLLRLGELESCLHDLNRSLNSGTYPQSLREKLETRKESCLASIRKKGIQEVDENATDPVNVRENDDNAEWRALCQFNNPLIPNASAKIKIKCDNVWGRHLVATEDIEPGEILSCQKFNALLLHEEKQKELTHCSYCLSKCLALIPCPTCTEMMFCSTFCRSKAYESYHRVECKIMYKANRPYKLRAMRMLIEGTEQGARVPDLMARMTARDVLAEKTDPSEKPFLNDYIAVLRMSRTFNPDLLCNFYTFVTDFISGLRDLGLCGADGHRAGQDRGLSTAEVFVGMLLMNHTTTARSHSFAIYPSENYACMQDVVGMGICALHSFVNNSCDPNVSFFTRNRQHVMVATRPIKKGAQLFHAYWRTFQCAPKEKRREILSMFFGFTCQCEACANDWLTVDRIVKRRITFNVGNATNAKKEFLELLRPLTGGRITELGNEDIIRCMGRICKWVYTNTKIPSYLFTELEAELLHFIVHTYDSLTPKYTSGKTRKNLKAIFKSIEQRFNRAT